MTAPTKERRDVSQSNLPTHNDGKLDLVAVLKVALTVPGKLSQCYNRFHRYSFLNIVLVFMQTGKLEPMGTFKKWQTLQRNVVKGSKALFVNHPQFAPVKDKAGNTIPKANGKGVEMKVVGFYPKASVFQLHQTDGPELVMPDMPDWDRGQAIEALELEEVAFSHHDGNVQGYSKDRQFALNPVAAHPFATMVHEWAHILLGHTEGGYAVHPRNVSEFQAEAVSLLVCHELDQNGYDDSGSRAYIQHWLDGDESDYLDDDGNLAVTDHVVREIFSATDKIVTAGRKAHFDKLEEQAA